LRRDQFFVAKARKYSETAPVISNFEFSGANPHLRFQILILGVLICTADFKI